LSAAAAATELETAGAVIVITGVLWRTARRYGPRGWRHLFWDAGALLANLCVLASASGHRARVRAAFTDADVESLLGLEPPAETAIAMLAVGEGPQADSPVTPPRVTERGAPVASRSPRFPRVEAAIASSSLGGPDEVRAWLQASSELRAQLESSVPREQHEPPSAPIEEVILRRGSTRRFASKSISGDELELAIRTALLAPDGDVPPLCEASPLISAVDGIDRGAYRFDPDDGLVLIRDGVTREEIARLCLDQPLAGEAAAVVALTVDLDAVLETLDERGYRAAQLAAGMALGRASLAAYAQGLGATGLTFYDDELRDALGTDREPLACVALGIDARRPGLLGLRGR
jgi:nitroreductase